MMITSLIFGLILANIGLIGSMKIIVNYGGKLHLLWLVPLFIFGAIIIGASLRETIM